MRNKYQKKEIVWRRNFIWVDDHHRTGFGSYAMVKVPMEMRIAKQYFPYTKEVQFVVYSNNGNSYFGTTYGFSRTFKEAKEIAKKEIAKIERKNRRLLRLRNKLRE